MLAHIRLHLSDAGFTKLKQGPFYPIAEIHIIHTKGDTSIKNLAILSQRGDFKVWLDSEHGYHPAKIEVFVGLGDDIGDPGSPRIITRADGITRRYTLSNVRFEKVDGVWVPMEADSRSHVVLSSPDKFSSGRGHFKRLKIVLNPDHDALGSFEDPTKNLQLDPELQDGTVLYTGDSTKGTWNSGKAAAEADDRGSKEGTP